MIEKNDLARVRKSLENHVGKKVRLTAKKGRKKTIIRQGIIESIYPSIFTVRLDSMSDTDGEARCVSFSYTDILTRAVEIVICRPPAIISQEPTA